MPVETKATQPLLFSPEIQEILGARPTPTTGIPRKPEPVEPQDTFSLGTPTISPECTNTFTGEVSYGKGTTYWSNVYDKLIRVIVAQRHLDPIGAEEAKRTIQNQLEAGYIDMIKFIERSGEIRGAEFYRQKALRFKDLRDVRNTCRLGLSALMESERQETDSDRKELENPGFLLLQIAHGIAMRRHGIYGYEPLPTYISKRQFVEKGEQNRKRGRLRKKEEKKMQKGYGQREDLEKYSLSHYADMLEHWIDKFRERFGGDTSPYDEQFKERFGIDLRAAGGTKEMRRNKEYPEYFEEILKHAETLNSYTLLDFALQAIYNPSRLKKSFPRRSEDAGLKLLIIAYEKAVDDPRVITNFKGYYEYVFRKVCLFLKSKTQAKGHAERNELVALIGRSRGGKREEIKSRKRPIEIKPDPNEIPF